MSLDKSKHKEAFISEAKEALLALNNSLLKLEEKPGIPQQVDELFRAAHNLKSLAATMGYSKMAALCHAMEDPIDQMRKKKSVLTPEIADVLFECFDALEMSIARVSDDEEESDLDPLISRLKHLHSVPGEKLTRGEVASEILPVMGKTSFIEEIREIKVKVEILDTFMNLTEELSLNKMHLDQLYASNRIGEMSSALDTVGRTLSNLQYHVMQARLIPIGQVFERFPRMIRDLAKKEKKRVNLVTKGAEIVLDRKILDKLAGPLGHLLRNAVVHGIEAPEERERLKKPSTGTVRLNCREENGYAIIEVEDDGRGISVEEIKDIAVRNGIVTEAGASLLSHSEVFSLLFDSRFSTSKRVTEVSGRGFGLNIVERTVDSLGGRVTIDGKPREGLKVSMSLPITLAFLSALLVGVGDEVYAIPLTGIVRTVRMKADNIRKVLNHEMVALPEGNIPLVRLGDLFHITHEGKGDALMVIVNRGDEFIGLGIDSILDKQEIIVKPANHLLRKAEGFSGFTILGDGRPVLILDINYFFGAAPSESEVVALVGGE